MTLDFGKLPFEKAFHFVAKLLPGFALLSLYNALHPGTIEALFGIPFLGYGTKLGLVAVICFLAGYSFASFISTAAGAVGGVIGYLWASVTTGRHPYQDVVASWRNEQ